MFLAVGTPPSSVDGTADLSYIFDAVKEIKALIKPEQLLVIKSTVPVGTNKCV